MIQTGLIILVAALFLGIIGTGVQGILEDQIFQYLTTGISVSGYLAPWKTLTGLLLLTLIPLGGAVSALLVYYSDNPEKRLQIIDASKKMFVALTLIGVSFFLYNILVKFTSTFPGLALDLAVKDSQNLKEVLFYTGKTGYSVTAWEIVNKKVAADVMIGLLKNGVYSVSLIFLLATLAFQRTIAAFGVLLVPLTVFMYHLPFNGFEEWSLNILKGLVLILFLPFLNILFLLVGGMAESTGFNAEFTHILSFTLVALINWSIIKKTLLNSFNSKRRPTPFKYMAVTAYRKLRDKEKQNSSGEEEKTGYRRRKRRRNPVYRGSNN